MPQGVRGAGWLVGSHWQWREKACLQLLALGGQGHGPGGAEVIWGGQGGRCGSAVTLWPGAHFP